MTEMERTARMIWLICRLAVVILLAIVYVAIGGLVARAEAIEITAAPETADKAPIYAIGMTEQEVAELKTIVAMEAQDEGLTGEIAVIEVIFNRVLSDEWPDTVHGVLSQKGQFATWKYLNRPYNRPGELEDKAVEAVITATERVIPEGYVFFATRRHGWMRDCIKLGGHWFGW